MAKTTFSCERGCKTHIFTEAGILSIWGSILEVILEQKMAPNWECGSLWGSSDAKWGSKMEVCFLVVFLGDLVRGQILTRILFRFWGVWDGKNEVFV